MARDRLGRASPHRQTAARRPATLRSSPSLIASGAAYRCVCATRERPRGAARTSRTSRRAARGSTTAALSRSRSGSGLWHAYRAIFESIESARFDGTISFSDRAVRTQARSATGSFRRSDGSPLFHLAVVVDDLDMEISTRRPGRRPPQQYALSDCPLPCTRCHEPPTLCPRSTHRRRKVVASSPSARTPFRSRSSGRTATFPKRC